MNKKIQSILKKILPFLIIGILFAMNTEISLAENINGLGKQLGDGNITITWGDIWKTSYDLGLKIIDIVRIVFFWILVILIVYAGIQMVTSMGTSEEDISKAKRTIWYSVIWIIFINSPIAIYQAFVNPGNNDSNLFIHEQTFKNIILEITNFMEIIIAWVAVFMLIVAGINLILSRGRDEKVNEAKDKVIWSVIVLLFVALIEVWKRFLFTGNISIWTNIFTSIANSALYIAGPIVLFFLALAGFYYITSDGEEERAKKGKTIFINILIGIVILSASYILLNDINILQIR